MALEVKVPSVGESITEVTIGTWTKEEGEYVELDDVICEIESDKASFEMTAEASGVLKRLKEEGDTVEIGDTIAEIDTSASEGASGGAQQETAAAGRSASTTTAEAPAQTATTNGHSSYASGHPSPAAGKILDEKGIPADQVQGSGREGRITKQDAVQAQQAQPAAQPQAQAAPEAQKAAPAAAAASSANGGRPTERKKMTALRKTIAKRLVQVKNETAMLTTFNEADMSGIKRLRAQYKDRFKEKVGVSLGFMSFFTKAVVESLKAFPEINAQIDGNEIVYHHYQDVGIAVSSERGLVVPVIRDAQNMTLADIEKEIVRLATRARDGQLSMDEMEGGTFSITNGGVFGSMMSTPIINGNQSAILGMHNIIERPVAVNGEVVIRPMMYLAVSYDHRIVDGKQSVSFLKNIKELVEEPERLLFGF